MKKTTPSSAFSFSKIYCSLFSHDYLLSKNVTHHIKEYTCSHCGEQATTNSRGRLEAMTPKLKEINNALASVHAKKQARTNRDTPFQAAS
jgi:transposase-like protein